MGGAVNVVALVRGEEQYVFVFDEKRRTELLRLLGRYAADPSLSFTWYDAAILSQKIREMPPAPAVESIGGGVGSAPIHAGKYHSEFHHGTPGPRFQFP